MSLDAIVLIPPETDVNGFAAACAATSFGLNIMNVVSGAGGATPTLNAAINAAGLTDTLSGEGPFTLLAPSEDAFSALPAGLVDCLLLEQNVGVLADILTYHVLPASVKSGDLSDGMTAATVEGEEVTVTVSDDGIKIDNALVINADFLTSNGVIHLIDAGKKHTCIPYRFCHYPILVFLHSCSFSYYSAFH